MSKNRGVNTNVDENFYRMMERARLMFKNKYGIKISSHVKLTGLMAKNPKLFSDKKWIKQVRQWTG